MPVPKSLSARSLQYYVINCKWASDLDFFDFESGFLHQLIEDNFRQPVDVDQRMRLKKISEQLYVLQKEYRHARQLLHEQTRQLELMAEDVVPEDTEQLAGSQIQLEYLMSTLTTTCRAIKRDLYEVLEIIMQCKALAG